MRPRLSLAARRAIGDDLWRQVIARAAEEIAREQLSLPEADKTDNREEPAQQCISVAQQRGVA